MQVKHRARRPEPAPAQVAPRRGLADFPSLGTPAGAPPNAGASSWKGTVAPRSGEVAKLPERFSASCRTSATSNGGSTLTVRPPPPTPARTPTPAPVPAKIAIATVEVSQEVPELSSDFQISLFNILLYLFMEMNKK